MSKNKFKRGFTLIELLVVIAIIGILASVVLASLNSARDKGADAAVKSNLNNARAQAELYYSNNGNYTSVCGSSGIGPMLTGAANSGGYTVAAANAAGSATTIACSNAATTWVASGPLKSASTTQYYCVDNRGVATVRSSAIGASATACN